MNEPTINDLQKSIEELRSYRDRLMGEVRTISQKLQIPEKKIVETLKNHSEINRISNIVNKLEDQLEVKKMEDNNF